MNETVTEMMIRNEAELRKVLPHFDARRLIGESIDTVPQEPGAPARACWRTCSSRTRPQIKVGSLTFGLIAIPIIDDKGERVGTVVEWKDRTAEVAVEKRSGRHRQRRGRRRLHQAHRAWTARKASSSSWAKASTS